MPWPILRIQPERFIEIVDGEIEQALIRTREPAVAERIRIAGIAFDGLVEIGGGTAGLANFEKDHPAIVVRVRILRVQPDGLVVVA